MARGVHHERLSALDATFLRVEDRCSHMHIGSVGVFEPGPATGPGGAIDLGRARHLVSVALDGLPRYRQRVEMTPLFAHPVWVDDPFFNLHYHLRHTRLPLPGDERQLKRLVARLMSQQLDRGKPLWEMWVVEGLDGDRFALITKVHHCMIDGVGSVELMASVIRATPEDDPRLAALPPRWVPRPAPSPLALFARELRHRTPAPLAIVRFAREAVHAPQAVAARAAEVAGGLVQAVAAGMRAASPTPLNVPIGPHRRFDWTTMSLATIRAAKGRLGGTINDHVLAMLSGALGRFLHRRGLDPADLDFRAMLPVNVRVPGEHLGNRVAMMSVRLPLGERDPRQRLECIVAETTKAKTSHQALGMRALEELSDRTFTTLFTEFARFAARVQPYNIVVTNVPGPDFPVFVLRSRMLACYPVVPLFRDQGLGVALISHDGNLHWGFNADWDVVPDLHDLVEAVEAEFEALRAVSEVDAPVRRFASPD
jgi:diacylglycerol O-acyltransferase / wax synthase